MEHQKKYKIIYADPAWVYQDKANAGKRGAEHKYTCTPTEEMGKLLDNLPIDKDAVCLMWVTYPQLTEQDEKVIYSFKQASRLERTKISALKKGISACEEILNSQQNKITKDKCGDCLASAEGLDSDTKSADKNPAGGNKKQEMIKDYDDSSQSPVQTLIKQALSNRNKKILEWLDNYSKENGEWYKYYVRIKDLKKQLTTEVGEK